MPHLASGETAVTDEVKAKAKSWGGKALVALAGALATITMSKLYSCGQVATEATFLTVAAAATMKSAIEESYMARDNETRNIEAQHHEEFLRFLEENRADHQRIDAGLQKLIFKFVDAERAPAGKVFKRGVELTP